MGNFYEALIWVYVELKMVKRKNPPISDRTITVLVNRLLDIKTGSE